MRYELQINGVKLIAEAMDGAALEQQVQRMGLAPKASVSWEPVKEVTMVTQGPAVKPAVDLMAPASQVAYRRGEIARAVEKIADLDALLGILRTALAIGQLESENRDQRWQLNPDRMGG